VTRRPPLGPDKAHCKLDRSAVELLGQLCDPDDRAGQLVIVCDAHDLDGRAGFTHPLLAPVLVDRLEPVEEALQPSHVARQISVSVDELSLGVR
jgi:hypothetical protein